MTMILTSMDMDKKILNPCHIIIFSFVIIVEKLEMPQFYSAVLFTTDWSINENEFTEYCFSANNTIPLKRFYSFFNKYIESKGQIPFAPDQYGVVGYYIVSHTVPRDEIIKMAESIK